MKNASLLLLGMTLVASGGESPTGSNSVPDRVGFPIGYATNYSVLRTVVRDNGAKLVTIYGNGPAASVTNKSQLPYPIGSILVMETASTRPAPTTLATASVTNAPRAKDQVLGLHVMRRGSGFGEQYGEKRSGEWDFVEYRADGTYLTPPEKSAACAECHRKAGSDLDYVFKARLTP